VALIAYIATGAVDGFIALGLTRCWPKRVAVVLVGAQFAWKQNSGRSEVG
jgi:hypothetical protein